MRQGDPQPDIEAHLGFFASRNRGGAASEASAAVRLADDSQSVAAAETDPLAEFKKSKAFRRLNQIGAINNKCELLNPYFRAQIINQDGTYELNTVYKIHLPFNNLRVLLTYWDKHSGGEQTTNRGHNDGSLWDMVLLRSNESQYKA